jgi:peroxygenase
MSSSNSSDLGSVRSQRHSHLRSRAHEPSFSPIYASGSVYTGSVALDEVEVTKKYSPAIELEKTLPHPGLARADVACDKEHLSGSLKVESQEDIKAPNASVLQQHVMFFDLNKDGIITPYETYCGFRQLGFNPPVSVFGACVIHGFMSYSTQESWLPDPFFRLIIKNMHRCVHGSDSNVYDREGRFIPQQFEDLFSKFDHDGKGGLYWDELFEFVSWNRDAMDFMGMFAARFEWGFAWWLGAEPSSAGKSVLKKETIRQIFDGTLFEKIARQRAEEKEKQRELKRSQKSSKGMTGSTTAGAAAGDASRSGTEIKKVQ